MLSRAFYVKWVRLVHRDNHRYQLEKRPFPKIVCCPIETWRDSSTGHDKNCHSVDFETVIARCVAWHNRTRRLGHNVVEFVKSPRHFASSQGLRTDRKPCKSPLFGRISRQRKNCKVAIFCYFIEYFFFPDTRPLGDLFLKFSLECRFSL
jgi:hypothetical protein